MRFIFTFLLPFLVAISALGASFGEILIQSQAPKPVDLEMKLGRSKRCSSIFKSYGQANLLLIRMGTADENRPIVENSNEFEVNTSASLKIESVPIDSPAKIQQDFFERAMSQWLDHGYTSQQVQLLREINDQLPPQRVQWVSFRFDQSAIHEFKIPLDYQGLSSVRIFDASTPLTYVLSHPIRYREIFEMQDPTKMEESLSPVELSPKNQRAHYRLPWRPQGQVKPVYLWHLGIGTNIKKFEGGLLTMFSHVAQLLDNAYNNAHYSTFKQANLLKEKEMLIFSSAKPDLIPYYQKLGFKVMDPLSGEVSQTVVTVNREGVATVGGSTPLLPDGMVLIAMKAEDFISKYSEYGNAPHILIEEGPHRFEVGDAQLSRIPPASSMFLEGNLKIQKSVVKISGRADLRERISNLNEIINLYTMAVQIFGSKYPEVQRMDKPEHEFFKGNSDYQKLFHQYRKMAAEVYRVINGAERELQTSEWPFLQDYAIKLLTDFPLEAYSEFQPGLSGKKLDLIEALELAL